MYQSTTHSRAGSDRSAVSDAYKVDVSRGERIGRVSSEWFSRPDDERYLSAPEPIAPLPGRSRLACSEWRQAATTSNAWR